MCSCCSNNKCIIIGLKAIFIKLRKMVITHPSIDASMTMNKVVECVREALEIKYGDRLTQIYTNLNPL